MRTAIYFRLGNPDYLEDLCQANILAGLDRARWRGGAEIHLYDDNGISDLQPARLGLQEPFQKEGTDDGSVGNMDGFSNSVPEEASLDGQLQESETEPDTADRSVADILLELLMALASLST